MSWHWLSIDTTDPATIRDFLNRRLKLLETEVASVSGLAARGEGSSHRGVAGSAVAVTAPADTSLNTLSTLTGFPGVLGLDGGVRLLLALTISGVAGTKDVFLKFNSQDGA